MGPVLDHFGGTKQCKCMVILRDLPDLPFKVHCLGLYYNDPCYDMTCSDGKRMT